jgi:hypothetical protein
MIKKRKKPSCRLIIFGIFISGIIIIGMFFRVLIQRLFACITLQAFSKKFLNVNSLHCPETTESPIERSSGGDADF